MALKIDSAYFLSAMERMRSKHANQQEQGYNMLLAHAGKFPEELIAEFRAETDHGLKCWLLELLADSRSEKVFDLFHEMLDASNLTFRDLAVKGLRRLNSKESKKLLSDRGF